MTLDNWVQNKFHSISTPPREDAGGGGGVKSRIRPPYPQRVVKRRLNGAVCPLVAVCTIVYDDASSHAVFDLVIIVTFILKINHL